MDIQKRILAFSGLGDRIRAISEDEMEEICFRAFSQNNWFTKENVSTMLKATASYLTKEKLSKWLSDFQEVPDDQVKDVGIVMAGNIPMVGFHDLMCVVLSGHKVSVKTSSKDTYLIQLMIDWLIEICPDLADSITSPDRLNHVDAIIATGSDNSARYFEQYFSKKPRIIRKNRSSIAVVSGTETEEQINKLATDIYTYFGLGCRNISKVFVPKGFDIRTFFPHFEYFSRSLESHKYQNNYDYNKSIYLINGVDHYDTGFGLFKKDEGMVSPISVVFYEEYESEEQIQSYMNKYAEKIQCVVSDHISGSNVVPLGEAQKPEITDYADGVNTLEFLASI